MEVDLLRREPAHHPSGTGRAGLHLTRAAGSGRRGADAMTRPRDLKSDRRLRAPEITDGQPCSGGPSRELHNIIGERGYAGRTCKADAMTLRAGKRHNGRSRF